MANTKDTAEYSATKAPETRKEAEEKETVPDARLNPGGAAGSPAAIGMNALDRDDVPSEARNPGLTRYDETPSAEG